MWLQGAHQQKQNMVFFGAAGIAGRPCLHALMSRWADALPLYTSCAAALAVVPIFRTKLTAVLLLIPVSIMWNDMPCHAHLARCESAGTHAEDSANK